MRKLSLLVVLVPTLSASLAGTGFTADIRYSGKFFNEGNPVSNGFVTLAYFIPGYNANGYFCDYGDGCNEAGHEFTRAVDDNVLFPLGTGTLTTPDGSFDAIVSTNAPQGTQLWLFAYAKNNTSFSPSAIASSDDPSWMVPAVSAHIVASTANQFAYGNGLSHPEGISLAHGPIPEPSTLTLCFASFGIYLHFQRNIVARPGFEPGPFNQ